MADKVDVLASSRAFCDALAAARLRKFPGAWSGSAYRRHPCGVIEGLIKLTNEWHVNNFCSIQITDGEGWSRDYSRDSFGSGNPHPKPISGTEITVWSNGRWASEEFRAALEPKVSDLLARMAQHVADAEAADRADRARTAESRASDLRGVIDTALARIGGAA